jgi:hypothetical protein
LIWLLLDLILDFAVEGDDEEGEIGVVAQFDSRNSCRLNGKRPQ